MAPRKGKPRHRGARPEIASRGPIWLYGRHAVAAALANRARRVRRVRLVRGTPEAIEALARRVAPEVPVETVDRHALDALLPGAVHQGIACLAEPLTAPPLDTVANGAPVVVLDRVTDPQNVGAILRATAAFAAAAVVLTDRHAPPESGALAKAASGALDLVPLVRVVNLGRAIEALQDHGYWVIGLEGQAPTTLAEAKPEGPVALVLGAEGAGLRRLTRERCDALARLPLAGAIESLNVAAAAAVALYEVTAPR